jgi:hypothetical protein
MAEFMIALRGYDIAEVDRLIAKSEEAAASDDAEFRRAVKDQLETVRLRRRFRGYAPHQVDRAIKDLTARLG